VVRHQARAFRSAPLSAHVANLERDGVTRDGEKGRMFGAAEDRADAMAFARRSLNDLWGEHPRRDESRRARPTIEAGPG
jgi:type IV secretory pathway VirD2 relaxase